MKTPLRSFLIMIAIIAALFGMWILMGSIMEDSMAKEPKTPEEEAAQRDFYSKLDELYAAKDYDGLVALANGPESDTIDLWDYPHYDLLNYYGQYVVIRDEYIPKLDKRELTGNTARFLTEVTFSFYYRCYDHTIGTAGNASEADLEELDKIRDEFFLDILYNRMEYTEEDMEAARNDIMNSNWFHADVADKYSDKYSERYR